MEGWRQKGKPKNVKEFKQWNLEKALGRNKVSLFISLLNENTGFLNHVLKILLNVKSIFFCSMPVNLSTVRQTASPSRAVIHLRCGGRGATQRRQGPPGGLLGGDSPRVEPFILNIILSVVLLIL